MTVTLLPIHLTKESFPGYTINKSREPITMDYKMFWCKYIDQAQWCVVDGVTIKAYGFSYDGWRIIDNEATNDEEKR